MQISKSLPLAGGIRTRVSALLFSVLAMAFVACVPVSDARAGQTFESPAAAQQQGISAYRGGYYDLAIPALEYAARNNLFLAQFYLGELYADNNSAYTDHARAYMLFQKIANDYADADPDDRSKAPYVAQAFTALARYVSRGMPNIALESNVSQAARYLRHAAVIFNDEDAQFELAKLYLKGEGVPSDVIRGRHWLASLAQKGHAGAQAFLADLYWRGLYSGKETLIRKDPVRALALISVAVKNTPPKYRVWIEDVYQNIYCGASKGVRAQVSGGMVAQWDKRYGRKPSLESGHGLGVLRVNTHRECNDGRVPPLLKQSLEPSTALEAPVISAGADDVAPSSSSAGAPSATAGALGGGGTTHGFVHSDAVGGVGHGFRNVGESKLGPPLR